MSFSGSVYSNLKKFVRKKHSRNLSFNENEMFKNKSYKKKMS